MSNTSILVTIDVEDWFQVENLKSSIQSSSWDSCEIRVEKNTLSLLDLFDAVEGRSNSASSIQPTQFSHPRATFFILGWVAERFPNLVREIYKRGHEVASHGYSHDLCKNLNRKELSADLSKSKKLLEDITGDRVLGYRAPNFSISQDVLKIVEDSGYVYDSSYNSFSMHDRYGSLDLSNCNKKGIMLEVSDNFYEFPVSNLNLSNIVIPWSGGGYFRLFPYFIFALGIRRIIKSDGAYLFYIHPWEIDPGQPKVDRLPFFLKFRHYLNLKKTLNRLKKLLENHNVQSFIRCDQYLDNVTKI